MTVETDDELVRRARAGDASAYGALVQRYYASSWRYAFRMLGSAADADDAVQDAMLKSYRALPKYQGRNRFEAWLMAIVVNECRNARRARSRRWRRVVASLDEVPEQAIREQHLGDGDEIAAALAQLEPKQREALLLKFGAGLDYAEMSAMLGVGASALKMRVHRAKSELRRLLQGEEDRDATS